MTCTAIFNIPPSSPTSVFFFLGQNYSENVFEFVNHFDSPSPLTFAGKSILCQKTVLPDPASSYNLLSCQGFSGSEALTALGTQKRKRRPGGQTPASVQAVMGSEKALSHPLLRQNRELGSNRGHHTEGEPHQAVASRYEESA